MTLSSSNMRSEAGIVLVVLLLGTMCIEVSYGMGSCVKDCLRDFLKCARSFREDCCSDYVPCMRDVCLEAKYPCKQAFPPGKRSRQQTWFPDRWKDIFYRV